MSIYFYKWFIQFILKLFLFGTISIILAILIFEIILRNFYKIDFPVVWQQDGPDHQLDSELIYINTPNRTHTYTTEDFIETAIINSLGYRNKEVNKKDKNINRVVVVGDSFVYGHGISDNQKTLPAKLEDKLNKFYPNRSFEVINTGVTGYSPDQEYRFILLRSLNLEPDSVIWVLNPNDFYNMLSYPSLYDIDENGSLVPTSANTTWIYWYGVISNNIPSILKGSKIISLFVTSLPYIPSLNRIMFISRDQRIEWLRQKLAKEIIEVNNFLKERKINLVLLFVPTKFSFQGNEYNSYYSKVKILLDNIIQTAKSAQIPYHDLGFDIWNIYPNSERLSLFFANDYHLNEKGANIVTDLIIKCCSYQVFK